MTLEGMGAVGMVHGGCAAVAVLLGGAMMLARKGTRPHRLSGTVYIGLMIAVNATAFGLYGPSGRPNLFHALAVVSLVTTLLGVRALRRWRATRDAAWLIAHQTHMAYSYLGLLMAFAAQLLVNPRFGIAQGFDSAAGFWAAVVGVAGPIYAVGVWLIRTRIGGRPEAQA